MYRILHASDYMASEEEFHCAFHTTFSSAPHLHSHDFYEIFYVLSGSILHRILVRSSPRVERLTEGTLVLIRPKDVHALLSDGDAAFRLVNVAFSVATLRALSEFLRDPDFPTDRSRSEQPMTVHLKGAEKRRMEETVEGLSLLTQDDRGARGIYLRRALFLWTGWLGGGGADRAVGRQSEGNALPPVWLASLKERAGTLDVLQEGLEALVRLSGRSHEHVSRAFRKHFGVTPTEHLNGLRLNYAANLLVGSDLSILDIALESGFSSPSYFHRVFRARFGVAPSMFRRDASRPGRLV